MTTKTVQILFHNYGCNSYTEMNPMAVYIGQEFKAEDTRCRAMDDDGLIMCVVSEVRDVEIPSEMEAEYYVRANFQLEHLWAVKGAKSLPVEWQKKLVVLGDRFGYDYSQDIAKLICQNEEKMRSSFRKEMKHHVESWMSDPEPKYSTPLSPKQAQALFSYERRFRH